MNEKIDKKKFFYTGELKIDTYLTKLYVKFCKIFKNSSLNIFLYRKNDRLKVKYSQILIVFGVVIDLKFK